MSRLSTPFAATGRYLAQMVGEIRKVVSPTGGELAGWAVACAVFVDFLMLLVTGMDYGLGRLMLLVFG